MKILVKNVDWDLNDIPTKERENILAEIPQSFFVPISDDTDYDEVEYVVSDAISDIFGYCHFGFDYEIIK